jgi:hypothetical protein
MNLLNKPPFSFGSDTNNIIILLVFNLLCNITRQVAAIAQAPCNLAPGSILSIAIPDFPVSPG